MALEANISQSSISFVGDHDPLTKVSQTPNLTGAPSIRKNVFRSVVIYPLIRKTYKAFTAVRHFSSFHFYKGTPSIMLQKVCMGPEPGPGRGSKPFLIFLDVYSWTRLGMFILTKCKSPTRRWCCGQKNQSLPLQSVVAINTRRYIKDRKDCIGIHLHIINLG